MSNNEAPPNCSSTRLLVSAATPGEGFGKFNLPMNTKELVWQLSNNVPCEVPRSWLTRAMQAVEQCFGDAVIKVEADGKIAQLTPIRAKLNDYGRRVLGIPGVGVDDKTPAPGSGACSECNRTNVSVLNIGDARVLQAKLKDEQAKNRNLMKLLWAVVRKHGGETRLNNLESGILCDDWELLEYTDMETLEVVIMARSAPNTPGLATAELKGAHGNE